MAEQQVLSLIMGLGFVGSVLALDKFTKQENFEQQQYPQYPQSKVFYQKEQNLANANFAMKSGGQQNVQSNNAFAGPMGSMPQNQTNINLNSSGDQLLAYQLYQQAVNASTPTMQQLDAISGDSQMQTGNNSPLQGGVSDDFAPYAELGSSEYQAVNIGNQREEAISACAQNSPTFVATSLLPKPNVPGQESWDISAPQDILATQNFLSATQQMGVDTVMSSLRNSSRDIRGDIPNPINVVSPFMQTTITPDLTRRPLIDFIPENGLYGPGPSGVNTNGTYVGYEYQ